MTHWRSLVGSEVVEKEAALAAWGARAVGIRSVLAGGGSVGRSMVWETVSDSAMIVLRDRSLWYPLLPRDLKESEGSGFSESILRSATTSFTLMGPKEWTKRLEPWLSSCQISRRVDYVWMERPILPVSPIEPDSRFSLRWAGPDDLTHLFRLQEAYEKEEVLFDPSDFRSLSSFWLFHKQLQTQWNVVLEEDGQPIAKAGTNALVKDWGQLGGVYTRPDRRGRGLQKRLLSFLLEGLNESRRSACLFVKKDNPKAAGLYRSLGFKEGGDFEISYWRR